MKVLQLGPYPPPHGGVQTNLVAIRQFLLERGIPCSVINITRHRKADADNVYYPKTAFELARLLLRLPYDIIHLHVGGHFSTRLLGLCLLSSLMPRSRAVLTFHSGGYPSSAAGRTARYWTLRGFVFRRLDKIIGVNAEIIEMFRKFGVPAERLHLIYPHVLSTPAQDTPLPETLKRFLESHQPVMLSVGLLEAEYDLPLQIEVLGLVRERFPQAGLIIIGSGSLEDELRRQIKACPSAEHILLCGDVTHPVTLRVIAQSDIMLRTTRYDGDSISVREALHLGTPVIATDNAMRPDGVDLIPPSDLAALRQAIEQRLSHSKSQLLSPDEKSAKNIEAVFDVYLELEKRGGA
jgi:glycosyltransferase involved in cell wall biosynthesis